MLNQLLDQLQSKINSEENPRVKKQYQDALEATLYRKKIKHFDDEKNIYELKFSLDYIDNPPIKTERKA